MKISKLASLATVVSVLAGCGGGGSSPSATNPVPNPAPAPATVQLGTAGIFSINYGGFTGVYTLLDDGTFSGLHFTNSGTLAGHPHTTLLASNSVNVPQPIAWANFIDDAAQVGAQEGAGMFGRTFDASGLRVSIKGSMGSFTASATAQRTYSAGDTKTLYGDPLPPTTLAGSYSGVLRTAGIQTPITNISGAVIDSAGNFTASAVNCTFAGKMVQHGTTGVFDVQVSTSGANCKLPSTLKGITTPLSVQSGFPVLGIQLDSADNAISAVFIISKL